jgi:hypothetical protein
MTIAESLATLSAYPISASFIESTCLKRGLTSTETMIKGTFDLQSYNLAVADILVWLYNAPNLGEQQISISLQERSNLLARANKIYGIYEDGEGTGGVCGFVGESFNG